MRALAQCLSTVVRACLAHISSEWCAGALLMLLAAHDIYAASLWMCASSLWPLFATGYDYINRAEATAGRIMDAAGYQTAHFGKVTDCRIFHSCPCIHSCVCCCQAYPSSATRSAACMVRQQHATQIRAPLTVMLFHSATVA